MDSTKNNFMVQEKYGDMLDRMVKKTMGSNIGISSNFQNAHSSSSSSVSSSSSSSGYSSSSSSGSSSPQWYGYNNGS